MSRETDLINQIETIVKSFGYGGYKEMIDNIEYAINEYKNPKPVINKEVITTYTIDGKLFHVDTSLSGKLFLSHWLHPELRGKNGVMKDNRYSYSEVVQHIRNPQTDTVLFFPNTNEIEAIIGNSAINYKVY